MHVENCFNSMSNYVQCVRRTNHINIKIDQYISFSLMKCTMYGLQNFIFIYVFLFRTLIQTEISSEENDKKSS